MRSRRGSNSKASMMDSSERNMGLSSRVSTPSVEDAAATTEIEQAPTSNEPLIHHHESSFPAVSSNHDVVEKLQRFCYIASHVLALVALLLVISWVSLLGGLSWKEGYSKEVFNWHPLFMITAFCFMTASALTFRTPLNFARTSIKLFHWIAWAVAASCATVALVAVFRSHNDRKSGFIANLYSLHSWIGCGVILVYIGQFVVGIISFGGYNLCSNSIRLTQALKARIMLFHKFVGPILYIATAATILLGIQEKEGFVGCAYNVKSADTLPFLNTWRIPKACLVSHALGLVVLVMAVSTSFALHNFQGPAISAPTRTAVQEGDRVV